jgi:uncharacterized YccA/Bax inhibitor family protein
MRSRNPVFNRAGFQQTGAGATASAEELRAMYEAPAYQPSVGQRMTLDDVVARTAITLGTVALTAAVTWVLTTPNLVLLIGSMIVGLVLGLVISFKHISNPAVILTYAAVEGVFLGMISELLSMYVGGSTNIVGQAVLTTFGVAGVMLAIYKFKVIRVTPKFVRFMTAAIGGFLLVGLLSFVLSMFGMGFGFGTLSPMGLLFSVIGAGLAAFSLLIDFEFIKQSVEHGVPERESWFAAFGLTVTLIWLYLEILRIYAILQGND